VDTSEVVLWMNEVAARALGEEPDVRFSAGPPQHLGASSVHEATERAARHVQMGTVLADDERLKRVKRHILRALRMITREQTSYNQAVVDALHGVEFAVTEDHDKLVARFQAALAAAELATATVEERLMREIEQLREEVRSLRRLQTEDRS
jgi:hypothetical protein